MQTWQPAISPSCSQLIVVVDFCEQSGRFCAARDVMFDLKTGIDLQFAGLCLIKMNTATVCELPVLLKPCEILLYTQRYGDPSASRKELSEGGRE